MQSIISTQFDLERFWVLAARLARHFDADLYLSECGYSDQNVSFVGVDPFAQKLITPDTCKDTIAEFAFADTGFTFGFLSYEYGMKLRGLEVNAPNGFPLGHMKKYSVVLQYDRANRELTVYSDTGRIPDDMNRMILGSDLGADFPCPVYYECRLEQSLEREAYVDGVQRTLELIRNGYTYQLNLSIRFTAHIESFDALGYLTHLFRRYPAPFYAWITSGRFRVISTSPERFLRVENGQVLSQPIKGTLRFDSYDDNLVRQLTDSSKESAELSMIIDLVRNDISLNCHYGSVCVENHKSTFVVDNLIQMYSNVRGELKSDRTCVDLLLDAFPGGSVTGCPKKKSMEIINSLEPHSRDVYCGSLFVIKDRRNMDSSIAIRTGYYDTETGMFHFFAGSGIVVDSCPEREYLETLAKAEKFLEMLRR